MIRGTSWHRCLTSFISFMLLGPALICSGRAEGQQVQVVNVIPATQSSQTNNDSEPNVTLNPANPNNIVVTAFTPCPPLISTTNAPIYFSQDGGTNWQLNCTVPGNDTTYGTGDITPRFAGGSGVLYAGILRGDSFLELNLLRTSNFTSNTAMTVLVDRASEDQPYTQAITASSDRVYVGNNNLGGTSGKTASVDLSLNAATAPAPAGFSTNLLESRDTCGQDAPPIRPAIHPNGTIYVAYYRAQSGSACFSGSTTEDVVVARDDTWGSGGFSAISDTDGKAGIRVATGVSVVWYGFLGNERLVNSQISIAVDPNDSQRVYVAWADGTAANYTLHVRQSTNGGANWGTTDLKTVSPATNPALAVNKRGRVGFLYQRYVNPGTCHHAGTGSVACWETHFEVYDGTSWTDLPHPLANTPDNVGDFPLGDYDHVLAIGQDFYGAFSASNYPDTNNFYPGAQFLRYADWTSHTLYADAAHTATVNPSADPFFFHVRNLTADQDFFVRDWTTSASNHDNGEEPSMGPNWWTTSDVWNRLTNTSGGFNANDQPNQVNAQDSTSGHNYAFVRVSRKAPAPPGSSDVAVQARFLYADYGLGVAYQDITTGPYPTLTFAAADTQKTLPDGSGVQWDLPASRSTHICMAVEISTPADPYAPELAGRAPGWPTTDWTLPSDNNKAQINMDLPPVAAAGGAMSFYAIAHNAAIVLRDMMVRYQVPPRALRLLEGAEIGIIGGRTQRLRESGTLVLKNMQPGENRWLTVSYSAPNARTGEPIPVMLQETVDGAPVNGLTIAAQPVSLEDMIRANLKLHRAVLNRMGAAFRVSAVREEVRRTTVLLDEKTISEQSYLTFLKRGLPTMEAAVSELLKSQRSEDAFGVRRTLTILSGAVASNEAGLSANNHASLLNKLDAFQTMLQKQQGDPADIVQMVLWQQHLYSVVPELAKLKVAKTVVQASDRFIKTYSRRPGQQEAYPKLIRELLASFRASAETLPRRMQIKHAVDVMELQLGSIAALEKVHREFLLQLQSQHPVGSSGD